MTKSEYLNHINNSIAQSELLIANYKIEYEKVLKLEEISFSKLIQEYEINGSLYFEKSIEFEEYTEILGGDGRSAPFDRKNKGLVLNIYTNGLYISQSDKNKFIQYLCAVNTGDIAAIKINDIQVTPK